MTLDGHRVAPLTTNRAESFIRKFKDEQIVMVFVIDSHAASDSGQIVVEPPRPGCLAKANYLMQVCIIYYSIAILCLANLGSGNWNGKESSRHYSIY
jgi:hypothetical protein